MRDKYMHPANILKGKLSPKVSSNPQYKEDGADIKIIAKSGEHTKSRQLILFYYGWWWWILIVMDIAPSEHSITGQHS